MIKSIDRGLLFLLFMLFATARLYAYDPDIDEILTGTLMYSGSQTSALKAFDDDASTSYSATGSTMQWVGLDLGEPHVITRVGFTPASGSQGADRMLLTIFEGANSPDFMDAIPLYLISSRPSNNTYTIANINVSRGFRYVRYVGYRSYGEVSYSCNIAELKFFGHAGEGDDSQFYQITNLPTLSVHVQDDILPRERGTDFESQSMLIFEGGTMIQEYPILFRVRGNFSATHDNKAFRMKYNDGKSHHMMRGGSNESPGKCKKWVLINSFRDKTLMRNPVAWAMSKRGERDWTPWCQPVDLIVNGDYHGTYTLADAVSVDKNRINITEMTEWDIDDETITGGYVIEADNNYSREPYHFMSSHGNTMSIHDPDEDVMQSEQFNYIKNYWNSMEDILFGTNYTDRDTGLRSVLDVETFLNWFLISEFNGNTDMICQVFHYKEREDDHFYFGPIWDADLALENDKTTYPANERMDWTYKVRQTGQYSRIVSRVLSDPSVFAQLQEMWAKLRKKGNFEPDSVAADVDSIRNLIRASADLNFIRWPYLTQSLSLNPLVPGSWEAEVDRVRDFVHDRVAWMDEMLSFGKVRQDENGVYQIASAFDLCAFSQMVNSGTTSAQAVFLNDIDMRDYNEEFQPIGNAIAVTFAGSLDGKGHTIRNLHLVGTDVVGLFGYVGNCTLKNIVFDESCHVEGTTNVGMLVGYSRNGAVKISDIENHGSVTAAETSAGGLVGSGRVLTSFTFTNCSNSGTVTAQSNAAALIGPSAGKVAASHCYNIGTIVGATEGKEFAAGTKSTEIVNCWDYTPSVQTNYMTHEQVDNGYLCYQLNYNAGGDKWRQNLDNGRMHDAYPVLRKNAGTVYEKEGRYTNINSEAAKFRYYNLIITKIQSGSTIQFSEFDILDDALNEVEELYIYDGPDNGYNNEGWENAADNSVYTKYCAPFDGYAYFLFDAGKEVDAYGYRIYTANDTHNQPGRNPYSWKLYGSNTQIYDPDSDGWVLIDERENDFTMGATRYTSYDFYIPHALERLTLSQHAAMLLPGEELQLEASYEPAAIQNVNIQWISTNEDVATVDEEGHVVAVGLGTADIIISVPNISMLKDTCNVTVVNELPGHRYYQLAIEKIASGSTIQFCEFDLLDREGNEVTPLTFISATGTYIKDHDAGDLFDDDIYTKYCADFNPANTLYIYMDAGSPIVLSGYRITTAKDTQSFPGRNPVTWSLLGSNTRSEVPDDEVWTLLDRREDDTTLGATNFTPYDFFFSYPQPVIMGDVNGDGEVDLADVSALKLYIIGKFVDGFVPEAADLNEDGKVNAQDLVLLLNSL